MEGKILGLQGSFVPVVFAITELIFVLLAWQEEGQSRRHLHYHRTSKCQQHAPLLTTISTQGQ